MRRRKSILQTLHWTTLSENDVLEEFDKDDDFRDEYAYYEAVLTYWNKYTEGNKVRLIF